MALKFLAYFDPFIYESICQIVNYSTKCCLPSKDKFPCTYDVSVATLFPVFHDALNAIPANQA